MIDATNRKQWDDFITSHEEANFLQSWDFYDFHQSRGNRIVRRIALDQKGHIVAAYAGVVEDARRGRYLAIAGGPILDWKKKTLVKQVFADMAEQGKAQNCVFVRVRPQLELSEKSLKLMAELGLKKAPMYLSVEYAGVLDLTKDDAEMRANMHRRIRYAINNAKNKGFEIIKSTDPTDLHHFYQIQLETAKRQGFVAFSEEYLTKQFSTFVNNNEAILYIAKYNGEILAENFMIFYGNEASYHYAVSTELGTKLSGSPILHEVAMQDARARGIKRYNMWGIVDENDRKHRFYGVSFFKRGFGVTELKYTPAHDIVLNRPKYLITKLVETIRRHVRHV